MAASVSQDFAGMDPGGDEFSTAGLNPANTVMAELLLLITYTAMVEATLKFDVLKIEDFRTFYTKLRDLSLKITHVIDDEIVRELDAYFATMPQIRDNTTRFNVAKQGVSLAIKLKDAMVEIGFMRFFDTPNDPPFMLPFFCASVDAYEQYVTEFEKHIDEGEIEEAA